MHIKMENESSKKIKEIYLILHLCAAHQERAEIKAQSAADVLIARAAMVIQSLVQPSSCIRVLLQFVVMRSFVDGGKCECRLRRLP